MWLFNLYWQRCDPLLLDNNEVNLIPRACMQTLMHTSNDNYKFSELFDSYCVRFIITEKMNLTIT
jgi:hypothetical protein